MLSPEPQRVELSGFVFLCMAFLLVLVLVYFLILPFAYTAGPPSTAKNVGDYMADFFGELSGVVQAWLGTKDSDYFEKQDALRANATT